MDGSDLRQDLLGLRAGHAVREGLVGEVAGVVAVGDSLGLLQGTVQASVMFAPGLRN